MGARVIQGDCIEIMAAMSAGSVDAIVTDPPAGISFMGREWDSDRGGMAQWTAWMTEVMTEALRVCKPGAHALVWALPRTSHWTGMALERAGWEVRDVVTHMFGSGFPKSLDVSRAIDKATGAEREVVGMNPIAAKQTGQRGTVALAGDREPNLYLTSPATPDAERWDGYGTALKPAAEFWFLARKPLDGTVAACVVRNGTGALNVDGCRVGAPEDKRAAGTKTYASGTLAGATNGAGEIQPAPHDGLGRWPANTVLSHSPGCEPIGTRRVRNASGSVTGSEPSAVTADVYADRERVPFARHADADGTEEVAAYRCVEDCPVRLLDEQTGTLTSGSGQRRPTEWQSVNAYGFSERSNGASDYQRDSDSGGASRFFPTFDHRHEDTERRAFYCAKASGAERNAGLDAIEISSEKATASAHSVVCARCNRQRVNVSGACECSVPEWVRVQQQPRANVHPCVKPIALMRWLVRLVTPPGGTVLDPFAGSGTTGIAAALERFDFVGIEREVEYVAMAQARIAWWAKHPDGMTLVKRLEAEKERAAVEDAGQGSLFGTDT